MKVIGSGGSGKYICVIEHTELEKFLNLYYNKLNSLIVGQEVDLGAGYNHWHKIQSACDGMTSAMKQFQSAQDTMLAFADMVSKTPKE